MKIGDVFRYSKSADPREPEVDGFTNYMHATRGPHGRKLILESGIYAPAPTSGTEGSRIGVVLIRSTSRTSGTEANPWHDYYDPNTGTVIYYGDAKPKTKGSPSDVRGNALLLRLRDLYEGTPADRLSAPPLIFFESEAAGFVAYQGFGVIERAELVTQLDSRTGVPFTNYRFECAVFSMTSENEQFDWEWINARRNPALSLADALKFAPASWQRWVTLGNSGIERVRRRVFHAPIAKAKDQRPVTESQADLLRSIYEYYAEKKHAFEALAETIIVQVMREAGLRYVRGWVTRKSADGGVDFVGRIDLGTGFGAVKVVVLGQAKCESPKNSTSGKDLARTVARLRRGWLGAYVTTGLFSERAQQEIIEDEYPLMLINGATVASTVRRLMIESGTTDLHAYLDSLDQDYSSRIVRRRPSDILFDVSVETEGTRHPSATPAGVDRQDARS